MCKSRLTRRLLFAIACAGLPWAAAQAAADTYRYDTTHSQILFSIDHNGFSRPFGRLHIAKGWLRFDPQDWSQSSTELDIDLASLDMGEAEWNAAVLKPAFLDAEKARYAHFVSTSVERKDDTHGVLHGDLTLRGDAADDVALHVQPQGHHHLRHAHHGRLLGDSLAQS